MIDDPPSAPQRGTGLALVRHWDWVAEKGLMPRNTALSIRAAVSQILKLDLGWETADVRQLDVDALISRFRNLSKLSPASLGTYESRFRSGLDSYLAYLDNPATYQPRGRTSGRRGEGQQPRAKRGGAGSADPPGPAAPPPAPVVSSGAKLVVYPFPVRPNLFAELKLPSDLTASEAQRLGKFLEAVALSEDDGSSE
jgi:hypothetical protein